MPNKAKPFVKWVGGKKQLLSALESLLPANFAEISDVTYIEPFVGGGAMFFFMLQKFPNIKSAVINDLNSSLINAYQTIKDTPTFLVEELQKIKTEYDSIKKESDRKTFYLNIRTRFNRENLSAIENSVYFIFLNHTCFNGLYRVNSKGEYNVPFGKYRNPSIYDAETIYADSELLQRATLLNGDFEQIEKYVTPHTFVYFDPPYRPLTETSSFNSYAKEKFDDREQIRLRNFFRRLSDRQCLLMLSNADCKGADPHDTFLDDLYKDFYIERVYATRMVNANPDKRGFLTELLIRNYTTLRTDNKFISQHHSYEQSAYRKRI